MLHELPHKGKKPDYNDELVRSEQRKGKAKATAAAEEEEAEEIVLDEEALQQQQQEEEEEEDEENEEDEDEDDEKGEEEVFLVRRIAEAKVFNGGTIKFKCFWEGYSSEDEDTTWEPKRNVEPKKIVEEFIAEQTTQGQWPPQRPQPTKKLKTAPAPINASAPKNAPTPKPAAIAPPQSTRATRATAGQPPKPLEEDPATHTCAYAAVGHCVMKGLPTKACCDCKAKYVHHLCLIERSNDE